MVIWGGAGAGAAGAVSVVRQRLALVSLCWLRGSRCVAHGLGSLWFWFNTGNSDGAFIIWTSLVAMPFGHSISSVLAIGASESR